MDENETMQNEVTLENPVEEETAVDLGTTADCGEPEYDGGDSLVSGGIGFLTGFGAGYALGKLTKGKPKKDKPNKPEKKTIFTDIAAAKAAFKASHDERKAPKTDPPAPTPDPEPEEAPHVDAEQVQTAAQNSSKKNKNK